MTRGQRIRKARTDAGISQTELAAKIKVSKQTLYKYENDIITNIPSDKIAEIAEICDVTPNYLMGWEGNPVMDQLSKEAVCIRELEKRIIRMNDYQKAMLLNYADFLLSDMTDRNIT